MDTVNIIIALINSFFVLYLIGQQAKITKSAGNIANQAKIIIDNSNHIDVSLARTAQILENAEADFQKSLNMDAINSLVSDVEQEVKFRTNKG